MLGIQTKTRMMDGMAETCEVEIVNGATVLASGLSQRDRTASRAGTGPVTTASLQAAAIRAIEEMENRCRQARRELQLQGLLPEHMTVGGVPRTLKETEADLAQANGILNRVNNALNKAGYFTAISYWEAIEQLAAERDALRDEVKRLNAGTISKNSVRIGPTIREVIETSSNVGRDGNRGALIIELFEAFK